MHVRRRLANAHNLREDSIKQRLSKIYDLLSKSFHESKGQVSIDLADSSLSHADVVALACFLRRYSVSYRVLDKSAKDVTPDYY